MFKANPSKSAAAKVIKKGKKAKGGHKKGHKLFAGKAPAPKTGGKLNIFKRMNRSMDTETNANDMQSADTEEL